MASHQIVRTAGPERESMDLLGAYGAPEPAVATATPTPTQSTSASTSANQSVVNTNEISFPMTAKQDIPPKRGAERKRQQSSSAGNAPSASARSAGSTKTGNDVAAGGDGSDNTIATTKVHNRDAADRVFAMLGGSLQRSSSRSSGGIDRRTGNNVRTTRPVSSSLMASNRHSFTLEETTTLCGDTSSEQRSRKRSQEQLVETEDGSAGSALASDSAEAFTTAVSGQIQATTVSSLSRDSRTVHSGLGLLPKRRRADGPSASSSRRRAVGQIDASGAANGDNGERNSSKLGFLPLPEKGSAGTLPPTAAFIRENDSNAGGGHEEDALTADYSSVCALGSGYSAHQQNIDADASVAVDQMFAAANYRRHVAAEAAESTLTAAAPLPLSELDGPLPYDFRDVGSQHIIDVAPQLMSDEERRKLNSRNVQSGTSSEWAALERQGTTTRAVGGVAADKHQAGWLISQARATASLIEERKHANATGNRTSRMKYGF